MTSRNKAKSRRAAVWLAEPRQGPENFARTPAAHAARLAIRWLAICLLILAAGCRNNSTPEVIVKKVARPEDDKTAAALEIFRQGGDQARSRDALNLLGPGLAREPAARLSLSPEARKVLETDAKLTPTELQELEATHFRPIDAAHVDAAALFRDAARSLEIPGLGELDQAEFAFDWVARRVLLFQQRTEGLPPAYVLRSGHGSATDRGLVFLALAHQLKLDGCLLIAPDMKDAPLVGVLVQKKLYLFDTRLGLPVPGPGGNGTASWDEVIKQPELLKSSKLSPEQVAALEVRITPSLEGLAPRMRFLESLLQGDEAHIGGDRLAVYRDVVREMADLKSAGVNKVGFWLPALRTSRQFESVDDGGNDPTDRAKNFARSQAPLAPVIQRYQELRVFAELPPLALDVLMSKITIPLFEQYYVQPSEMLIRGKSEALPRRLDRIRTVIDDGEVAGAQEEQELAKQAAAWRERVNQAYLAAIQQGAEGAARVNSLWQEDQYLIYLLRPEEDEIPRNVTQKTLSRLVLSAVREPLGARANWLFASLSQDKAERAQETLLAQRDAGKEAKAAAANARNAWLNARSAWSKYLDRNNLGPGVFKNNLPAMRFYLQRGDTERLLAQWEYSQRELHQYAAARLEQAQAIQRTGQNANPQLEVLVKELEQLQTDETLAKERAAVAGSGLLNSPEAQRRWGLLQRDWGPAGNFAWIQETARLARQSSP